MNQSNSEMAEIPTFDAKRTEDGVCLVFRCPKCGEKNVHGAVNANKGAGNGHRASHCQCWEQGYYIREV